MKKFLALLLALVMVIGLVACGAKEEAAAPAATEAAPAATEAAPAAPDAGSDKPYEGQVVSWWTYPYTGEDQAQWEGIIADFTAETGIIVETTIIPWGAEGAAKLSAGFLGGTGPDVLYMTAETAYDLISAGHLADLSTVLPAEVIADQLYAENTKADGVQYMLPFSGDLGYRAVIFNTDLLKAAGVDTIPTTRDELLAAAQKIQAAGVCEYPVMFPATADAEVVFTSVLGNIWSAGGDFVANGEVCFDSAQNLETMKWLNDLVHTYGVVSEDCTGIAPMSVIDLFEEGKVAIAFAQVSELVNRYRDESTVMSTINWTHVPSIAAKDGDQIKTFCPVDMIAMNANAKNPEAAAKWLEYLMSADGHGKFRETFSPGLLKMSASEDYEYVYVHDSLAEYGPKMSEFTRGLPIAKGTQTMLTDITTNFQLMIMGELTPEEAVDAIQAACEAAAS